MKRTSSVQTWWLGGYDDDKATGRNEKIVETGGAPIW